ncbi:MAG: DUF664 domain-containing protein [Trueperaceae bacterium]
MSLQHPLSVGPHFGTRPLLETLASQLGSHRYYLLSAARELGAPQLDTLAPGCSNSIGAILAHVAAAEVMIRNLMFHDLRFAAGQEDLERAFRFDGNHLAGQDMAAYRDYLKRTHEDTLSLLAEKDDAWLATPRTFAGRASNIHYYWTHLMMDESRHTGQVILIRKRLLPGSDGSFNPYVFP